MSIDRLKRRLRSVGTLQAVFACVFSLLLVTSGSLVFITTAQESPDGVEDGATFTVRTGGIYPDISDGGQICADKIEPDVNKVTVTDSTLQDVDIYLGKEGSVESHVSFPSGDVDGELVLYTNGENPLVNTLATLGICLPPGVPNPLPTTLEAYWLGVDNLQTEGLEITSGGDAPSVSGPELPEVLNETDTSREELGINNSTETNNSTENTTTTPTNETTNNTTTDTVTPTETPTNETTNETGTNETTETPTNETANETGTNETTETPTETPTNETAPTTATGAQTDATATTTETEAESQIFSQETDAQTGTTPTSQITGDNRATQATSEPVETTQPSATPTEDDEDGILSGVLGPLFG